MKGPTDEEDEMGIKTSGFYRGQFRTDDQTTLGAQDENRPRPQVSRLSEVVHSSILRRSQLIRSTIVKLEIPSKADMEEEEFKTPQQHPGSSPYSEQHNNFEFDDIDHDFSSDGYETAEDSLLSEDDFIYPKLNIFEAFDEYSEYKEPIPQEAILQRINSHRRTRSYQLGEQLQFRWTTGAGPRIGCVRDYPSRLQFEVMEQLQLSPRSDTSSPRSTYSSPTVLGSSSLRRENVPGKSLLCPDNLTDSGQKSE